MSSGVYILWIYTNVFAYLIQINIINNCLYSYTSYSSFPIFTENIKYSDLSPSNHRLYIIYRYNTVYLQILYYIQIYYCLSRYYIICIHISQYLSKDYLIHRPLTILLGYFIIQITNHFDLYTIISSPHKTQCSTPMAVYKSL